MAEFEETIIDSTKPNAGRVYDYLIGGNHNFEIDRQMAKKLIEIAPFLPKQAKYIRWFLQEAIRRAKERGFTQFLDFASGLPTADHIHNNTPEGTKVVYSDIDPVTVEYGKDIIGENPLVKYITCDAAKPENLLELDIVKSLFGDNHKAAFGMNGICWFLTDEQLGHAAKILYDWADEGSILFLSDSDNENPTEESRTIETLYANMKQPLYPRSKNQLIELVKPWELEEPGFLLLEEWYDMVPKITEETVKLFGGSGLYGGFLKK